MQTPNKAQLVEKLRPFGQEHLLRFWDDLDADQRATLARQIADIEFAQIAQLVEQARATGEPAADDHAARARRAEPPPAIRLNEQKSAAAVAARARGEQALRDGKLGAVIVAGGQGSRLGFEHPKGLYPIGPVSQASLLQILFEKVAATGRRYGAEIPLYIMTSPATHEETVAALAKHDYFGLGAQNVCVFCQGTMPAVDEASGQLLLESKGSLFLSPDGHGGMVRALDHSGALGDMRKRGLTQLFYMQVDNPLVVVCDPLFVGYHLTERAEVSTEVVAKTNPRDRVGNVASIDGQVQIIEYSDLPDDVAELRTADGSLKLWAGNIAVHVFDVAFLQRMASGGGQLPFHFARKKVPYVNDAGDIVEPEKSNAIKFEQFIFDLLPAARAAIVVEVDERAVFAPVKNAPGAERDSPEYVRAEMIRLHRGWLAAAGAQVDPHAVVEISPLFALDAAEVAQKIEPGRVVAGELYLQ